MLEDVATDIVGTYDPAKLKTLPEIEDFFSKSYRSMVEEWATHQMNVDVERFKMQELEE